MSHKQSKARNMMKLKVIARVDIIKHETVVFSMTCPGCGIKMISEGCTRFDAMEECPYCKKEIRRGDVVKDE